MKKICIIVSILICMCLSACTKKEIVVEQTSIYIHKDGTIEHIIVEPFDKEYYNIEQLEQSIEDEILQFNTEETENITLDKVSQEENQVIVNMTFKDGSYFEQLNDAVLIFGLVDEVSTLEDAQIPSKLISKETGEEVVAEEIENLGSKKIVITDQKIQLISEEAISYYAGECTSVDENTIDSTNNKDLTYLILN